MMSRLLPERQSDWLRRHGNVRSALARRDEPLGPHPAVVVAGLAAVGLGLLMIYWVGPDIKRYMKIKNM